MSVFAAGMSGGFFFVVPGPARRARRARQKNSIACLRCAPAHIQGVDDPRDLVSADQ
jgi:hypothetical protein